MNKLSSKADTPLYDPVGFVMVRAPLLSCNSLQTLLDVQLEDASCSSSSEDNADESKETFARSAFTMRQRILKELADPIVEEAILVGSSELFQAIPRWQKSLDSKKTRQAQTNLLRYLIRMTTRPTPFGLFAGVALASIGPMMDIRLEAPEQNHKRTRPDMQWLLFLVRVLEQRSEVVKCLNFFTNSMSFISGGRLYLPHLDAYGQAETDKIVSLRATPAVIRALALATDGSTLDGIKQKLLAERPDATDEQVQRLLDGLREQGALHSDLRPPLTGKDPISFILRKIDGIPNCNDIYEQLHAAHTLSEAYDEKPIGQGVSSFQALNQSMLIAEAKIRSAIEVDMATTCKSCIFSEAVAHELALSAETILRLSIAPLQFPHLAAYRHEFVERYGAEREVPLLELLDENAGLGPPPTYQSPPRIRESPILPLPQRHPLRDRTLLELAATALRNKQIEIELDEATVARLQMNTSWKESLPDSLELYVSVVARSQREIDAGNYQLIVGPRTGTQPAGCSFGRFYDILGEECTRSLIQLAREEEHWYPEKIFAELVYLPSLGHAANVALRPSTREFEIVVACTPSVQRDKVIRLDDLVVGIHGERFYLRSVLHNAEVEIRNTHLLNYASVNAPNECRFLAEISSEETIAIAPFDWGAANGLAVLPRVRLGRLILCPATWHLPARMVGTGKSRPDANWWYRCVQNWRQEWGVPRYVYLSQGDNRLLIDLQNPACVEDLGDECRKYAMSDDVITLQEMLPSFEHAWTEGADGQYLLEFVVPLQRHQPRTQQQQQPHPAHRFAVTPNQRFRSLGSDWIYAKLYSGQAIHDDLLAGPVRDLLDRLSRNGLINRWFFVRYFDPESHLRLRFQGEPTEVFSRLLPVITAWSHSILDYGLVCRIAFDTYDREVERYGGMEGINLAEQIFAIDSNYAVDIVSLRLQKALNLAPLDLAILTVEKLVANLGLRFEERISLYRMIRQGQEASFRNHMGHLAQTFFDYRKTVQHIIGDRDWLLAQPGGIRLEECINTRAANLEPIENQLHMLSTQHKLWTSKASFISSCVHMHCNRVFGVNRLLEFELAYYLERTLDSLRKHMPNGIHVT